MQSIGERLEEARKRRGISVREASEATKIRGEFLLGFENNQFDVGLPEIYVRGFLRNYARFLKVDPEKIVTDFTATQLADAKPMRKDSRELFGRLEIPERPRPTVDGSAPTGPSAPRRRDDPADPGRAGGGGISPQVANYLKIGAIIAAGIVAVLVIVWLMMAIIQAATGPSSSQPPGASSSAADAPTSTITLIALDDVQVKVTQAADQTVLFDGPLARGERRDVQRNGAVYVAYTVGANLRVESGGQAFGMTQQGIGRNLVP